jgi:hypothetical protein
MISAGLSLRLHDLLYQTDTHWVFERWWKYAKQHYVRLPDAGPLEWAAWYYDPLIDYLCQGGSAAAGALVFYLSPQHYDDAQRLYEESRPPQAMRPSSELRNRLLADPRVFAAGLLTAREMGDTARYQALHALAEQFCEPTWDREHGEFYYRFGLGEPYPRGQANACIMAAEAGSKQAWWRIFNEPNLRKFNQPTVCGVDFPRLGISQAIYNEKKETLAVSTYSPDPWMTGTATTFTVDHLHEPAQSRVLCDGSLYEEWRVSGETSIQIKVEVQDHAYLVVKSEGQ